MKTNTTLLTLVTVFLTFSSWAQNILITSPGFGTANPLNCANYSNGDAINFFDSGAADNDYGPNENNTITICPNLPSGPKIIATFGINAGFIWDVAGDDQLTIYDGPTTAAPVLGVYNTVTHPNGFSVSASFENNPSGCLTFVFTSNASNQGAGWAANISCGNPPQPFFPGIQAFINGQGGNALNPADTGYVDICYGDSILFVANATFPYSFEDNGFKYPQSNASVTYAWTAGNGQTGTGNQFWFTPPLQNGYLISLMTTDLFPQSIPLVCKVRVSVTPDFSDAGPLKDTICINEQLPLIGGANQSGPVGVSFPPGSFSVGGSFGGLLPLPDGSGVAYSTDIFMTGFGSDATVQGPGDISSICVNIEHSYLGDLEMWIQCPNGQTAILFNSFAGTGPFPGGFAGGGIFLGDANDQGNGNPGIGFTYCFSTANATFGTMGQEHAAQNFVQVSSFPPYPLNPSPTYGLSMNPNGVYLSEQGFDALIGCPLNGDWTLFIQDNLAQDDGYVFNWSINFDADLLPDTEIYQNSLVNHYWESDPTIVSVQDTMIVISTDTPGSYNYTFVIEDNFGCTYDTTFTVFVKDPIVLNIPTQICHDTLYLTENQGFSDGLWTVYNSPAQPTFVTPSNINPMVVFPQPGVYNLVYSDLTCPDADTATIELIPFPYTQVGSDTICLGDDYVLQAIEFYPGNTYSWNTGATTSSIILTDGGTFTVTVTNVCGSTSETVEITAILCDFEVPNVFTPNGDGANDFFQLVLSEGLQAFNIVLVNRWGQVVREFNNADFEWDGKDEAGNDLAEGVYFYRASGTILGGEVLEKHGFVHLVRQ
jgi:gliding motility-associated-like protein